MRSEWTIMRAGDFIQFNPKLHIKKGQIATKVSMDKLRPFTKKIPETEKTEYGGGSKFCNGDTIMARITPCLENGKTAFVDILDDGETAFGSTEFIVMSAKEGISDPQFVYYLATSPAFRKVAIKSMVGTTGRQRVQQGVLSELELLMPPLEEQQRIGKFLGILDEKIALNEKVNDNLEQQAQALFTSRFSVSNYKQVPDGWKLVSLGDIAVICTKTFNPQKQPLKLLEHYSIPAFDEARYPVFEFSTEIKSNKFIVDSECILISKLNPTTKRVWRPYCITDNAVCSTEFVVYKAKEPEMTEFLCSLIDSAPFSAFMCSHVTGSTGSRQRTIPSDTLQFEFYMPTIKELDDFSTVVMPIYSKIRNNIIENARLRNLRDTLLPKLMSGEIDVSDVAI